MPLDRDQSADDPHQGSVERESQVAAELPGLSLALQEGGEFHTRRDHNGLVGVTNPEGQEILALTLAQSNEAAGPAG